MKSFLKIIKNRDGFTLQELMIAVSLFIIVIALASASFVHGIRAQREVVTSTSANSNISQAIERMAREIRTGHTFGGTPSTTTTRLVFINSHGEEVRYELDSATHVIQRCVVTGGSCTYVKITAEDIYVEYMRFWFDPTVPISEITSGPTSVPRITVAVGVRGIKNSIVRFQTTVASRIIGI